MAQTTIAQKSSASKDLNTSMLIMQCIGIIAVVLGHADIGGEDIPNILNVAFPYYSWHMPMFIFISGYFFNRTLNAKDYIIKKLRTHLLPAFIVNAVCGLFSFCIHIFNLADYGREITLRSLFITPFTTGYQFYIDVSLWFIFALVVIEILACVMDRLARGKASLIYLAATFLICLYCCIRIYYDHNGTRNEFVNALLRLGYLMFFFWLGICYRQYAETHIKKFINYKSSLVIFSLQAALLGITGYKITTNVRDMNFIPITVPNGFWVAIVAPITATVFFLGLSYSLSKYIGSSRTLAILGRNTKYIVYYHQLCFVLFSIAAAVLSHRGILTLKGFSLGEMRTSAYYTGGNLAITCVVAIMSIVLPVVLCRWIDKQKKQTAFILYASISLLIVLYLYIAHLLMR